MQLALGVLGWPPRAFWKSTPAELYAAVEGWQEKNGIDPKAASPDQPSLTAEEVEELSEMMDRYPDVWN